MAFDTIGEAPLQMTTRSLAVIVVAHNDASGLAATVERLYRALVVTAEEFEILICDDGSSDETLAIANQLAHRLSMVRVIRFDARMGAGQCFRIASEQAQSNFQIYIPADNTWPYRSYVELFGNLGKADVITSYSSNFLASVSWPRRFISQSYTWLLNAVFRFGLHYYNGLTIYPSTFTRTIKLASLGFGFQAEALIKALSAGYTYIEVALPTDDASTVTSRSVTPRNIADAVAMLIRLAADVYFFPSSALAKRHVRNPVTTSQTIDEIGLGAKLSGMATSAPITKATLPKGLRIAITGASSGIGEALARALGAEGHRIFVCARRGERLREMARELPSLRPITCDVTDEQQVADLASTIAAEVDGLDVLINCAGIFGEIGSVDASESQLWWDTMRVNLFGPYLITKRCLPLLQRGTKPRVINMAGGGAFSAFANYSAYACSKAALVRLTECMAAELQPKSIRVNAVSPGIIATDIHKATLAAGEDRAGRLQYRRTLSIMADGGPPMDQLINCVRAMLSPSFDRLTGKTISANFDPWQTDAFVAHMDDIASSDLYTLRRVNMANLNDGYLRKTLSRAWANFGSSS